jgi:hypothetical protein
VPVHVASLRLIKVGSTDLGVEKIVRNFPRLTYSVASTEPDEIVNLLAHEANEWSAVEINRVRNRIKRRLELFT